MSNTIKASKHSVTSTPVTVTFPSRTINLEVYNEGVNTVFFQTDNETLSTTIGIPVPVEKSYKAWVNVSSITLVCEAGETATVRVIAQL